MNGNDNRAAAAIKARPILEEQASFIAARTERIELLTSRLHEIANRTFGHSADPADASVGARSGPTGVPGCTLAQMSQNGDQCDKALNGLERAIDRFDPL